MKMLALLVPLAVSASLACRPARCWSGSAEFTAYEVSADSSALPASPLAPTQAGPLIKINLPAYQLDLFEGVDLVRRYRVAIGDTAYPTPIGTFEITHIDWDPWWVPPQSEWARKDTIMPPGPRNPMGRVRLAFRELYFIHGTPEPRSVGSAASHGCVRLYNADAVDLAKRVLRYAAPSVPEGEIDSLAARRGKTRTIQLERFVPVEIRYDIAVVEGEKLIVYPDVYRRLASDAVLPAALDALERATGDSAAIDTAAVRAVIEQAGGKPFSTAAQNLWRSLRR
ncbi:MAG: L,D-transpeptidase family protein [Gemmatimonadetes bacterium]|nr:L,D-transpeptidase family protein [Gemmatimonadota bacterium]